MIQFLLCLHLQGKTLIFLTLIYEEMHFGSVGLLVPQNELNQNVL